MLSATKALVPVFSCVWACLSFSLAAAQSFDDLTFRLIGPAVMGGRIDAIAVVKREPSTFYVGYMPSPKFVWTQSPFRIPIWFRVALGPTHECVSCAPV